MHHSNIAIAPYLDESAGLRIRYGTASSQADASNFRTVRFAASPSTERLEIVLTF